MEKTAPDTTSVLVTDGGSGGSRDSLGAVRALAAAGYRPEITVSPGASPLPPSRYATRWVAVPAVWEQGFADAVGAELRSGRYLTVLPTSEEALKALGAPPPHLADKIELEKSARTVGLAVPQSHAFGSWSELLAAAAVFDYPIIVKPTVRRYRAFRADSAAALATVQADDGPALVQRYVDEPLHAVAGVVWRGRLVAAVHERWLRIWPLGSGLACAAETVAPDADLEDRLLRLLAGYDGIFVAQFAGRFLFDVNLRVASTLPLAVAAGANLAGLYCDLLRGREVAPVRARAGAFFRWLEGDVRHVARAVKTGDMSAAAALSALRPRRGVAHSTESLRDPGPMAARLWYAVRRVRLSEAERSRGMGAAHHEQRTSGPVGV